MLDNEESPLETAQRLVRTVARAFYADDIVVVLDAMVRDRYLQDNNMDKRVGIQAKQVSLCRRPKQAVTPLRSTSLTPLPPLLH